MGTVAASTSRQAAVMAGIGQGQRTSTTARCGFDAARHDGGGGKSNMLDQF